MEIKENMNTALLLLWFGISHEYKNHPVLSICLNLAKQPRMDPKILSIPSCKSLLKLSQDLALSKKPCPTHFSQICFQIGSSFLKNTYRRFGDVASHCDVFAGLLVGDSHHLLGGHCCACCLEVFSNVGGKLLRVRSADEVPMGDDELGSIARKR